MTNQTINGDRADQHAEPVRDTATSVARSTAGVANGWIHELGEGPVWDPARGRLLWVDIRVGTVFTGTLDADGAIRIRERIPFGGTVGAVAVSHDGEMLIAAGETLLTRSPEGTIAPGTRVMDSGSSRRLNDGGVDPAGRFLVGTLNLQSGDSVTETLVAVDADGSLRTIDDDLTLSNGLAWSVDGGTLYSVDTLRQVVYRRSYDSTDGTSGPRGEFLTLADGYPDGITVDAEDHLWVAMWGLGQVHRYSHAGELSAIIDVPAPHTSSVAFAGPLLDTLVITTATQDLDQDQLDQYPDSGRLFTAIPGVLGAPQPLWAGSTGPTSFSTL